MNVQVWNTDLPYDPIAVASAPVAVGMSKYFVMFAVAHSKGSCVVVGGGAMGIRFANSVLVLEEAVLISIAFARKNAKRKQIISTPFILAISSSRIRRFDVDKKSLSWDACDGQHTIIELETSKSKT